MVVRLDLHRFAAMLGGGVRGDQIACPGPNHSSADRSLSVRFDSAAPEGFVVNSFANDDPIICRDHVRSKCGLPAFNGNGCRDSLSSEEIQKRLRAAVMSQRRDTGYQVATYKYTDEDGATLYEVLKFENPKSFKQRRPSSKDWIWNLDGVRRVPYRLFDLIKFSSATTFITEGEKDADRLAENDLVATTAASGKWDGINLDTFAGRDCMVLEDNDQTGRDKALDVATRLHSIAATVRIVRLPGLPEHGDVSDWLDAGHTTDELAEFSFNQPLWDSKAPDIGPAPKTELVTSVAAPSITPPDNSPLPFINLFNWYDQPIPRREWCVLNRIPMRNVTLFSGEGAIGKSIICLQLSVAHVLAKDWLQVMPEIGPVLVVACEDDSTELHHRLALILDHYQASFADLGNLHIMSLAGGDALLVTPDRHGLVKPTKLFDRLRQAACDLRPKLIVLDNSADVFGGSENDRVQVRQFIGILRGLAIAADTAVLLTSHPSLTGMNSGTGLSGSTAWNASVRSRLWMKRATTEKDEELDPNLRVIEVMKSNYGPVGETITVRWKDGVFVPEPRVGSLQKLAEDQRVEWLFLKLLNRFAEQGRTLSASPTANNYAPAMFVKDPGANGTRKQSFADAMNRLFNTGKIQVEQYGRPAQPRSRLIVTEKQ
jgi:RecA-family ATPase